MWLDAMDDCLPYRLYTLVQYPEFCYILSDTFGELYTRFYFFVSLAHIPSPRFQACPAFFRILLCCSTRLFL